MSHYNNEYRGNSSNGGEVKKHSGCKLVLISKGSFKNKTAVVGWRYVKRTGLIKYSAWPYGKTKERKSKTGKRWMSYILKIQLPSGETLIRPCLFSPEDGRVFSQSAEIRMNPKGGYGGYVGPLVASKRR